MEEGMPQTVNIPPKGAEPSAPFLCVRGRDIVRLALASFWFSVIIEATELQEEVHAHIISFEPNCR